MEEMDSRGNNQRDGHQPVVGRPPGAQGQNSDTNVFVYTRQC